jgi:hypothetical protein
MGYKGRIMVGLGLVALLLGGGAFMAGRLLGEGGGNPGSDDGLKVKIGTGNGKVTEVDYIRAEELPEEPPPIAGAFERRQDNSIFVNETGGGFALEKGDDGKMSVTNATGKISEVVVTTQTDVYVDLSMETLDQAAAEGVLRQIVEPGTVEEIGELSFVRAWGEMRGDRLVASVLLYTRPPVLRR